MKSVGLLLMVSLFAVLGCRSPEDANTGGPAPPVLQIPPPYVKIEAFGTLGTIVIDGLEEPETTGCVIMVRSQAWELDLQTEKHRELAGKLDGKLVYVSGTPEFRRYTKRGPVPTIVVEDMRPSESFLPQKK